MLLAHRDVAMVAVIPEACGDPLRPNKVKLQLIPKLEIVDPKIVDTKI